MMIMMRGRRCRRRRHCHESHLECSKDKMKDNNGLIPPSLLQIGNPRIVEKDIILGVVMEVMMAALPFLVLTLFL